jgi:hypothetical protein
MKTLTQSSGYILPCYRPSFWAKFLRILESLEGTQLLVVVETKPTQNRPKLAAFEGIENSTKRLGFHILNSNKNYTH